MQIQGRLSFHRRGFGFLTYELPEGGSASAFVPPPELNRFFAGDLVRATVQKGADGRLSASGLELVERSARQLLGEVVLRRGKPHLRMEKELANTDWPLEPGGQAPAEGELWLCEPEGTALRALRRLPAGADPALYRVVARHGLLSDFSAEAREEAEAVLRVPHALLGRRDLRQVPTITVDAPSTRDIDDAIAVLPAGRDGAVRLLVSIADVSAFVHRGSALDRAARDRATSVYLVGQVLPMLPEAISTEHLSLLPGVDRACLTVEMRIDPEGQITAVDVYESLIRSAARLSYDEVARYLDHDEISPAMAPLAEALPWLRTAFARLQTYRARRGGVVFARDEARFTFDPLTGEASGLQTEPPSSAHAMIERFMVAANEAIAGWLSSRGVPTLFRVHDEPGEQRVADLDASARNFGLCAGFGRRLSPVALAAFEAQIAGKRSEQALRQVMRRLLGPARYSVEPGLHFGLGAPLYLHFTSPIRRYADLCVHRAIRDYLAGRRQFDDDIGELAAVAAHVNDRAWAATKAESDHRRIMEARLFSARIGETFAASVTKLRPFGVVAQLEETLVEGAIPIDALPDGPWQPDARRTAMVTSDGRTGFSIGTPLRVKVVSTDVELGRIELALADDAG